MDLTNFPGRHIVQPVCNVNSIITAIRFVMDSRGREYEFLNTQMHHKTCTSLSAAFLNTGVISDTMTISNIRAAILLASRGKPGRNVDRIFPRLSPQLCNEMLYHVFTTSGNLPHL